MFVNILQRQMYLANTDPQRRCYDGHNYSSEWRWTSWGVLETWDLNTVNVEARLEFWRELNAYAVSQRGKGATCEYKLGPVAQKDGAQEPCSTGRRESV